MMISYAITVCNEHKEIEKLLSFLFQHKRPNDQIVIQMDTTATEEVVNVVMDRIPFLELESLEYKVIKFPLDKNFAAYKNNLNKNCDGDWVFQIDADETPHPYLIEALPFILESNIDTEAFWVPRVNTVKNITDAHVEKWGWKLSGPDNWVNFPDWQMRIYKNKETVYWINPVHEQLKGYKKFTNFPAEEQFALYHPKDIIRQEKQNAFYETI